MNFNEYTFFSIVAQFGIHALILIGVASIPIFQSKGCIPNLVSWIFQNPGKFFSKEDGSWAVESFQVCFTYVLFPVLAVVQCFILGAALIRFLPHDANSADPVLIGASVPLLTIFSASYGLAFISWRSNKWFLTRGIQVMMAICVLAFVITIIIILAKDRTLSFFSFSAPFITANFIFSFEFILLLESASLISVEKFFSLIPEDIMPTNFPDAKSNAKISILKRKLRKIKWQGAVLYSISFVFLLAYAIIMVFRENDRTSMVGFIIMGEIIFFDILVFLLTLTQNITRFAQVVLIAGSRFWFIYFGIDRWYFGCCLNFLCYATYLGCALVNYYFPLKKISHFDGARFSKYLEDQVRGEFDLSRSTLCRVLSSNWFNLLMTALVFGLVSLIVILTDTEDVRMITSTHDQVTFGTATISFTICFTSCFLAGRLFERSHRKFSKQFILGLGLMHALILSTVMIQYALTKSRYILILGSFLPFAASLAYFGFWWVEQNDWSLITPSAYILPPGRSIWKRIWFMLGEIPIEDKYSLAIFTSLLLAIFLPAILIHNDSTLSSAFGWTLAIMIMISFTSTYPMAKYAYCLTLERDCYVSICFSLLSWITFFAMFYVYEDENWLLDDWNKLFFWLLFILLPSMLLLISAALKFKEDGVVGNYVKRAGFVAGLLISCVILLTYALFPPVYVTIFILLLITLLFAIRVFYLWIKNGYYLETKLRAFAGFLAFILFVLGFASPFIMDVSHFWGLSTSWLTVAFGLLAAGLGTTASGTLSATIHLSQNVFPIYAFNMNIKSLLPMDRGLGRVLISAWMLLVWTLLCTLVEWPSLGLASQSFVLVFLHSFFRQRLNRPKRQFTNIFSSLNYAIYKETLDMTKKKILEPLELDSYHELTQKISHLLEDYSGFTFKRIQSVDAEMRSELLKDLIEVKQEFCELNRQSERYLAMLCFLALDNTSYFLEHDRAMMKSFMFWLRDVKKMNIEDLPEKQDGENKKLCMEIRKLKEAFTEQQQAEEELQLKMQDEQIKRRAALGSLANIEYDVMQKEYLKLEKLLAESKEQYVDKAFPPSEESLYEGGIRDFEGSQFAKMSIGEQWKRISQLCENPKLFPVGKVEPDSVVQGQLGDCYMLSAALVLAQRNEQLLRDMFESQVYSLGGIYLVKFWLRGHPVGVIVDDFLPMRPHKPGYSNSPIFARCREDDVFWLSILEKAYAKLNGSFESIIGGQIHQCLVDFTNGFGSTIPLRSLSPAESGHVWQKIVEYSQANYLLGAGSRPGSNEESSNGIVFGHAYAILRVHEDSRVKLLQLQNPWGKFEWTGDWSDSSKKWTKYYKNKLHEEACDEGTFWMCFDDFIQYFTSLWVCRVMERNVFAEGVWDERTATGLKDITSAPQYNLTVSQPGTLIYVRLQSSNEPPDGEEKKKQYISVQLYDLNGNEGPVTRRGEYDPLIASDEGSFKGSREVEFEFTIPKAHYQYRIVAITYHKHHRGVFNLSIYGDDKITLEEVKAVYEP